MHCIPNESPLLLAIREGHFLGAQTMVARLCRPSAGIEYKSPFCGQGSSLRVAIESGDRFFIEQSLGSNRNP